MTVFEVARPGAGGLFRHALPRTALRYGVSIAGPAAVSAAHFLASLAFLRALPAQAFGLLSFVMVIAAFAMSAGSALIVLPINETLARGEPAIRAVCCKVGWLFCAAFAVLLAAALLSGGAGPAEAALLGLYGGVFAWRWFARSTAYIDGNVGAAVASDLVYSAALTASLGALGLGRRLDFAGSSEALLLSALLALAPFGTGFFREQVMALRSARLTGYLPLFRDITRWSLAGVALTELTVNAHAYLVTFLSGAQSFALLALGMLLMRPASLVQNALPDLERPAMTRAIAVGDFKGLARIHRHFTLGLAAAWAGTAALAAGLLVFAPGLLLKKGYALHDVVVVAALSAAIMAVRTFRTPPAVLLQAAGRFKALAGIGTISGVVSLAATLAILLAFGPIASLGGVLLGEAVILVRVVTLARHWRADHA
ncbi:MAG TPA: hypothetical protein VHC40_13890 [Rhizomicrobium sp.]|nr:hypothetical protein [Rhizomicrobium sp.]